MAKVPGKAWATFGFATGIIASIAANVAHSFVPPAGSANWHPHPGAIVFAAFWPVALLIAIEVIARVDWPHGKGWAWVRYGGLVAVAAIAATLSYRHMAALLAYYGEDHLSAAIGPLAVDGLMAVCTAALLATTRNRGSESAADGLPELAEGQREAPELAAVLEAPSASEPVERVAEVPRPTGSTRPSRRRGKVARLTAADRNAQAEAAYAASLAADTPLTYQQIAEQYGDGRGERWARDRMKAVRQARQAA